MGWASGSEIATEIWRLVREHIPKDERRRIAIDLVHIFEDQDCDTMHEAYQLMSDAGMDETIDD